MLAPTPDRCGTNLTRWPDSRSGSVKHEAVGLPTANAENRQESVNRAVCSCLYCPLQPTPKMPGQKSGTNMCWAQDIFGLRNLKRQSSGVCVVFADVRERNAISYQRVLLADASGVLFLPLSLRVIRHPE